LLLEITPDAWNKYEQRKQRKGREYPYEVHIGGDKYIFTPTCEVPDHMAEIAVTKRPYLQQAKLPNDFTCTFCTKELKSLAGRKAHERSCKEKQ
jgi:hypothetical protein